MELGLDEVYSDRVLIDILVLDLFVGNFLNRSFIVEKSELDGLKMVNFVKIVMVRLLI